MGNPLLNSLEVHHSRALLDLKQGHPDQIDLLVGKHNVGETVTAQKQATGTKQKNTEQNAHYLLTIRTRRELEARGVYILNILCSIDNPLSLSHVRARQALTHPRRATTRLPTPTMTTARPCQRLGVIVRAGAAKGWCRDPCGCPGEEWGHSPSYYNKCRGEIDNREQKGSPSLRVITCGI
jgi:hypothetical protein